MPKPHCQALHDAIKKHLDRALGEILWDKDTAIQARAKKAACLTYKSEEIIRTLGLEKPPVPPPPPERPSNPL